MYEQCVCSLGVSLSVPLLRVPNRFFGVCEGFLLFEAQASGFYGKLGATFGIESMRGRWDAKNNPRDLIRD